MSSDNLSNRLNRIRGQIVGVGRPAIEPPDDSRYTRLARATSGQLISNHAGSYCLITSEHQHGTAFGSTVLRDLTGHDIDFSCFSAYDCDGSSRIEDFLFFDLETTGLGGAGTVPFLIGFGSVTATGLEVRQYLLPDYSDERAMLEDAAGELASGKTLVSYNGAAFDLNIIKERFIINRVDAEFTVRSHVDLLHTTRRLFRRRLGDCSLVNIERELFGFHRRDDIPGYLVPSVFFAWLSEENAYDMKLVLKHNRLDILTLYFLLELSWRVFVSGGRELEETLDIYSLSRVYGGRKQTDRVVELLDGLVQQDRLEPDMRLYQALALKRLGRWSEAVELWTGLVHCRSRVGFLANIELAKYYEHRLKDFRRAYKLTGQAISLSSSRAGERRQAEHRLRRLRTRMTRR